MSSSPHQTSLFWFLIFLLSIHLTASPSLGAADGTDPLPLGQTNCFTRFGTPGTGSAQCNANEIVVGSGLHCPKNEQENYWGITEHGPTSLTVVSGYCRYGFADVWVNCCPAPGSQPLAPQRWKSCAFRSGPSVQQVNCQPGEELVYGGAKCTENQGDFITHLYQDEYLNMVYEEDDFGGLLSYPDPSGNYYRMNSLCLDKESGRGNPSTGSSWPSTWTNAICCSKSDELTSFPPYPAATTTSTSDHTVELTCTRPTDLFIPSNQFVQCDQNLLKFYQTTKGGNGAKVQCMTYDSGDTNIEFHPIPPSQANGTCIPLVCQQPLSTTPETYHNSSNLPLPVGHSSDISCTKGYSFNGISQSGSNVIDSHYECVAPSVVNQRPYYKPAAILPCCKIQTLAPNPRGQLISTPNQPAPYAQVKIGIQCNNDSYSTNPPLTCGDGSNLDSSFAFSCTPVPPMQEAPRLCDSEFKTTNFVVDQFSSCIHFPSSFNPTEFPYFGYQARVIMVFPKSSDIDFNEAATKGLWDANSESSWQDLDYSISSGEVYAPLIVDRNKKIPGISLTFEVRIYVKSEAPNGQKGQFGPATRNSDGIITLSCQPNMNSVRNVEAKPIISSVHQLPSASRTEYFISFTSPTLCTSSYSVECTVGCEDVPDLTLPTLHGLNLESYDLKDPAWYQDLTQEFIAVKYPLVGRVLNFTITPNDSPICRTCTQMRQFTKNGQPTQAKLESTVTTSFLPRFSATVQGRVGTAITPSSPVSAPVERVLVSGVVVSTIDPSVRRSICTNFTTDIDGHYELTCTDTMDPPLQDQFYSIIVSAFRSDTENITINEVHYHDLTLTRNTSTLTLPDDVPFEIPQLYTNPHCQTINITNTTYYDPSDNSSYQITQSQFACSVDFPHILTNSHFSSSDQHEITIPNVKHDDIITGIDVSDHSLLRVSGTIVISSEEFPEFDGCGMPGIEIRAYIKNSLALDNKGVPIIDQSTPYLSSSGVTAGHGTWSVSAPLFTDIVIQVISPKRIITPSRLDLTIKDHSVNSLKFFDSTVGTITASLLGGNCRYFVGDIKPAVRLEWCSGALAKMGSTFNDIERVYSNIPAVDNIIFSSYNGGPSTGVQIETQTPSLELEQYVNKINEFLAVSGIQRLHLFQSPNNGTVSIKYITAPTITLDRTGPFNRCLIRSDKVELTTVPTDDVNAFTILPTNSNQTIQFIVSEIYGLPGNTRSCDHVTDTIMVTDTVSDPTLSSFQGGCDIGCAINVTDSSASYSFTVGAPELSIGMSGPLKNTRSIIYWSERDVFHKKSLNIFIIGMLTYGEPFPSPYPIGTPIFTLHDPPGDSSYSFVTRDSAIDVRHSFYVVNIDGTKSYLRTGAYEHIGLSFPLAPGGASQDILVANSDIGAVNAHEFATTTQDTIMDSRTQTVTTTFSTSADPNRVGRSGTCVLILTGYMLRYRAYRFEGSFNATSMECLTSGPHPDQTIIQSNDQPLSWVAVGDIEETLIPTLDQTLQSILADNEYDLAKIMSNATTANYYNETVTGLESWHQVVKSVDDAVANSSDWTDFGASINSFHATDPNTVGDAYLNAPLQMSPTEVAESQSQLNQDFFKFLINGTTSNLTTGSGSTITSFGRTSLSFTVQMQSTRQSIHSSQYFTSQTRDDSYYLDGQIAGGLPVQVVTVGIDIHKEYLNYDAGSGDTRANLDSQLSITRTYTTGFVITDNNLDDWITFKVKRDAYGNSPIFEVNTGHTMCPHEPKTLNREQVKFKLDPASIALAGLLPDEVARIRFYVTNASPTDDTFSYNLQLDTVSNPDGLLVFSNGVAIASNSVILSVKPNTTATGTLEVSRAVGSPFEYGQNNVPIRLIVTSVEGSSSFQNLAGNCPTDTFNTASAGFSVKFQHECNRISWAGTTADSNMFLANRAVKGSPGEDNNAENGFRIEVINPDAQSFQRGWLQGDPNLNPELLQIHYQYRPLGGNPIWQPMGGTNNIQLNIMSASSPKTGYYSWKWDVFGLPDGKYEFRIVSECNFDVRDDTEQRFYSTSIKEIIIDQTLPAVFGQPTPIDRSWYPGQSISVTYSEDISCEGSDQRAVIIQSWLHDTCANQSLAEVGLPCANNPYDAHSLTPIGTSVEMEYQCRGNTIYISFAQYQSMIPVIGQLISVKVIGIQDTHGNPVESDFSWSFQIGVWDVYRSFARLNGLIMQSDYSSVLAVGFNNFANIIRNEMNSFLQLSMNTSFSNTTAGTGYDFTQQIIVTSLLPIIMDLQFAPNFQSSTPSFNIPPMEIARLFISGIKNRVNNNSIQFPYLSNLIPYEQTNFNLTIEPFLPHPLGDLNSTNPSGSGSFDGMDYNITYSSGLVSDSGANLHFSWSCESWCANTNLEFSLQQIPFLKSDDLDEFAMNGDAPILLFVANQPQPNKFYYKNLGSVYFLSVFNLPIIPGGSQYHLVIRSLTTTPFLLESDVFVVGSPTPPKLLQMNQLPQSEFNSSIVQVYYLPSEFSGVVNSHNLDCNVLDGGFEVGSQLVIQIRGTNSSQDLFGTVTPFNVFETPMFSMAKFIIPSILQPLPGTSTPIEICLVTTTQISISTSSCMLMDIYSVPHQITTMVTSQVGIDKFRMKFMKPMDASNTTHHYIGGYSLDGVNMIADSFSSSTVTGWNQTQLTMVVRLPILMLPLTRLYLCLQSMNKFGQSQIHFHRVINPAFISPPIIESVQQIESTEATPDAPIIPAQHRILLTISPSLIVIPDRVLSIGYYVEKLIELKLSNNTRSFVIDGLPSDYSLYTIQLFARMISTSNCVKLRRSRTTVVSEPTTRILQLYQPPPIIHMASYQQLNATAVKINYLPPSDNVPVQLYRIGLIVNSIPYYSFSTQSWSANDSSITLFDLPPCSIGSTCSFVVFIQGWNVAGWSSSSMEARQIITMTGPPNTPQIIEHKQVVTGGASTMMVSITIQYNSMPITSQIILDYMAENSDSTPIHRIINIVQGSTTTINFTLNTPLGGDWYRLSVQGQNIAGLSGINQDELFVSNPAPKFPLPPNCCSSQFYNDISHGSPSTFDIPEYVQHGNGYAYGRATPSYRLNDQNPLVGYQFVGSLTQALSVYPKNNGLGQNGTSCTLGDVQGMFVQNGISTGKWISTVTDANGHNATLASFFSMDSNSMMYFEYPSTRTFSIMALNNLFLRATITCSPQLPKSQPVTSINSCVEFSITIAGSVVDPILQSPLLRPLPNLCQGNQSQPINGKWTIPTLQQYDSFLPREFSIVNESNHLIQPNPINISSALAVELPSDYVTTQSSLNTNYLPNGLAPSTTPSMDPNMTTNEWFEPPGLDFPANENGTNVILADSPFVYNFDDLPPIVVDSNPGPLPPAVTPPPIIPPVIVGSSTGTTSSSTGGSNTVGVTATVTNIVGGSTGTASIDPPLAFVFTAKLKFPQSIFHSISDSFSETFISKFIARFNLSPNQIQILSTKSGTTITNVNKMTRVSKADTSSNALVGNTTELITELALTSDETSTSSLQIWQQLNRISKSNSNAPTNTNTNTNNDIFTYMTSVSLPIYQETGICRDGTFKVSCSNSTDNNNSSSMNILNDNSSNTSTTDINQSNIIGISQLMFILLLIFGIIGFISVVGGIALFIRRGYIKNRIMHSSVTPIQMPVVGKNKYIVNQPTKDDVTKGEVQTNNGIISQTEPTSPMTPHTHSTSSSPPTTNLPGSIFLHSSNLNSPPRKWTLPIGSNSISPRSLPEARLSSPSNTIRLSVPSIETNVEFISQSNQPDEMPILDESTVPVSPPSNTNVIQSHLPPCSPNRRIPPLLNTPFEPHARVMNSFDVLQPTDSNQKELNPLI